MYVVVTRQGYGDLWSFATYSQADEHPLFQFGDAICHNGDDVARMFNPLDLPGLATRLGHPLIAREMEKAVAQDRKKHREYGDLIWQYMKKAAQPAPLDPSTIVALVQKDRRLTKRKDFVMAKKAKKVEDQVDGEGAEGETTEKVARSARTKVDTAAIISFLSDKDGNPYSAENNPKRPGSASHDRFKLYREGMTVGEAIEAGLKRDDITWDVNKQYISISAA